MPDSSSSDDESHKKEHKGDKKKDSKKHEHKEGEHHGGKHEHKEGEHKGGKKEHKEGEHQQGGKHSPKGGHSPKEGRKSPKFGEVKGDKKPFVIVSEMNKKVLDIEKGNEKEGTRVLMYDENEKKAKNQLWYLDPQGYIRSALNDMAFCNNEKGQPLKMMPFKSDPNQQWRIDGKKIVNGHGLCLDIRGKSSSNSAKLCAYDYNDASNQHWTIEFGH